MNPPRCDDLDYIQFLIAAQKVFTCTEAAQCQPKSEHPPPAHDAFTRLLSRKLPDTEALWEEVQRLVQLDEGMLVLDDTTLDKPYASEKKMELVTYPWSQWFGTLLCFCVFFWCCEWFSFYSIFVFYRQPA